MQKNVIRKKGENSEEREFFLCLNKSYQHALKKHTIIICLMIFVKN